MTTTSTRTVARHWIDGAWADSREHHGSVDPATGQTIGAYALGTRDDAERAVASARRAFESTAWRTDRQLRARVLTRMAERFEERAGELVEILGLENGKVHDQGALEVAFAPETLRFNAALALTDVGTASVVSEGEISMVLRQPVGVAGIIAPWNSPVALGIRSLAPALAGGCTAVMSLPRQTAQTNALMAELIGGTEELPPGVANVITGGHVTGDLLVRSPDVPTISFTGSTKTGATIGPTAAEKFKRVGLEPGGKTPLILFPDADLDRALPIVVSALIVFSGQFCMTGSRLLVHEAIADQVRSRLTALLEAVKVGPAAEPASEMGPLISRRDVERIDSVVEDAIRHGRELLPPDAARGPRQRDGHRPGRDLRAGADLADLHLRGGGRRPGQRLDLRPQRPRVHPGPGRRPADVVGPGVRHRVGQRLGQAARPVRGGRLQGQRVGRMRGFAVIDDFVEHKHVRLQQGTVPHL